MMELLHTLFREGPLGLSVGMQGRRHGVAEAGSISLRHEVAIFDISGIWFISRVATLPISYEMQHPPQKNERDWTKIIDCS